MNKGQCQSQGPHKESKSNMRVCLCVSVRTLQEQYVTSAIFQQHGGSHRKACCAFVCVWVQETGNLISSTATRPHSRYSLPPPQKNPLRCYCPQLPDSGRDHNEEEEGNKKPAAWFFFLLFFFYLRKWAVCCCSWSPWDTRSGSSQSGWYTRRWHRFQGSLDTRRYLQAAHSRGGGGSADAVR